jgi:hypothetical protein
LEKLTYFGDLLCKKYIIYLFIYFIARGVQLDNGVDPRALICHSFVDDKAHEGNGNDIMNTCSPTCSYSCVGIQYSIESIHNVMFHNVIF